MWRGIELKDFAKPTHIIGFRVVENQDFSSTWLLSDNSEDHELLEQMIDESKPPMPEDAANDDYLLNTPFRYPPLWEGTRFGTVKERAPFYGSETVKAALVEKNYRLTQFEADSDADFDNRTLSFTSFRFIADAQDCLDLLDDPFLSFKDEIHNPDSHLVGQELGTEMRECDVDACIFESVRCSPDRNFALFTPAIFRQKSDEHTQWTCFISPQEITFRNERETKIIFKRS